MKISKDDKARIKRALISILVGAIVAFISELLHGLLEFLKTNDWDFTGPATAMLYYLKSRKVA